MSLLSIVKDIALRVNYSASVLTAFASTDPAIQLMVACAQDAGDDAVDRVDWAMLKEQTPLQFTGDGTSASFQLSNQFRRLSPSDTFISSLFPTLTMPGPINENELLALKALPVVAQPSVWRQVGFQGVMSIEFFPVLQAQEVVTFYQAQGTWITDNLGAPLVPVQWTADTNKTAIPERVVRTGAIWRWKKFKGLDYAQDMDDAERILDRLGGQEKTVGPVHMSREYLIDDSTWFPGTINSLESQV